ncbi:MAG: hypothetical protein K9M57_04135 [Phycisphaerae bacterium]|nr:hypothetical protein [Phycisphaerae bacterium]
MKIYFKIALLAPAIIAIVLGLNSCQGVTRTPDNDSHLITFPQITGGDLVGAFIDENNQLVTVIGKVVTPPNYSIRVSLCDLKKKEIITSNYVSDKAVSWGWFCGDTKKPVVWQEGGWSGFEDLYMAEYHDNNYQRRVIFKNEDKGSIHHSWFFNIGNSTKLFILIRHYVFDKQKDDFVDDYWIYSFTYVENDWKLNVKQQIPNSMTGQGPNGIQISTEGDDIYIWMTADSGESRQKRLVVAKWKEEGDLTWKDCYKASSHIQSLKIDPYHGSKVLLFESTGVFWWQPSKVSVCQIKGDVTKVTKIGSVPTSNARFLKYNIDSISWIMASYYVREFQVIVYGLNENYKIVKKVAYEFDNKTEDYGEEINGYSIVAKDNNLYLLAMIGSGLKIKKLEEFSEGGSGPQKEQKKSDGLQPETITASYNEYIKNEGKGLIKADNHRLADDIVKGTDNSAIISYYRLVGRDKALAEMNLSKRLGKICTTAASNEAWMGQMQLGLYGKPAVKHLLKIAQDGTVDQRRMAIQGLSGRSELDAVDSLVALLENMKIKKDAPTYISLCNIAIGAGNPKGIDYLIKVATDKAAGELSKNDDFNGLQVQAQELLKHVTAQYEDIPKNWNKVDWCKLPPIV